MKYTGKKLTVLLTSLLATTVVLCSCNSSKTANTVDTAAETTTVTEASESSASDAGSSKIMLGASTPDDAEPDAFSSYTFSLNDGENNYMITVSATDSNSELKIITEDNEFNYSEYTLTPPENYTLNIPYSQEYASGVCSVLTNTADDRTVPDIVQFIFYLDNFDTEEELPYTVKRCYSVKDNEFTEIGVYDEDGSKMDCIPEFTLLRTEGTVFMPTPTVTFDDNGDASVELSVYDFDTDELTLKKRAQSRILRPTSFITAMPQRLSQTISQNISPQRALTSATMTTMSSSIRSTPTAAA